MTRQILFRASFSEEALAGLRADLRSLLADEPNFHDFANYYVAYWELEPPTFHFAPFLRKSIPESKPISLSETSRNVADKDPQDASLVLLMPDQLKELVELEAPITPKQGCSHCGRAKTILRPDPILRARFPTPLLVNGLFYPQKSAIRVISGELLSLLEARGLLRGASTFPVEAEGPRDNDHFGIYSTHALEPAAPYGNIVAGDPCPMCGTNSPRHAFYETFHRPSEEVDWYHRDFFGPGRPVVTQRVYHFLRNEGAPYVGTPLFGRPLEGIRMGWYPDDKDRAFLPERFQGLADEPVEPIRPDELERLLAPAVPLPKPTKARTRKPRKPKP